MAGERSEGPQLVTADVMRLEALRQAVRLAGVARTTGELVTAVHVAEIAKVFAEFLRDGTVSGAPALTTPGGC